MEGQKTRSAHGGETQRHKRPPPLQRACAAFPTSSCTEWGSAAVVVCIQKAEIKLVATTIERCSSPLAGWDADADQAAGVLFAPALSAGVQAMTFFLPSISSRISRVSSHRNVENIGTPVLFRAAAAHTVADGERCWRQHEQRKGHRPRQKRMNSRAKSQVKHTIGSQSKGCP